MNAIAAAQSRSGEHVERWYGAATVRNAARIVVPAPSCGEHVFPRSRQLLADHPEVVARGEDTVARILAQSAYRYMYEIGLLETRYVIDCALNIINDKIAGATDDEKRQALTIVIDEGYHAYVALDFIIQLKDATGFEPIAVPQTNRNLDAVRRALESLPGGMHPDFHLISVCLAEHTLTKDLLSIGKEKEATRSFTQVMTDHVSDEGRHANYFAQMMKAHWARLPEATKTAIATMLPEYLDDYLAGDATRSFDRMLLKACGFDAARSRRIIEDTDPMYLASLQGYIEKTRDNLVRLLERAGMLEHPATRASFSTHLARSRT